MTRKCRPYILIIVLISAIGSTSCSHRGPSAEQIARGKDIFDTSCAPCHVSNTVQLPTAPPKLDGLFQKPTLPSGAPATDEQVRQTIINGKGIMPPFGPVIHDDDMGALIAYLHTR